MEIEFKIIDIKNNLYVLKNDDDIINWPKKLLPKEKKVGDTVCFDIDKDRAKDILNEILNP